MYPFVELVISLMKPLDRNLLVLDVVQVVERSMKLVDRPIMVSE